VVISVTLTWKGARQTQKRNVEMKVRLRAERPDIEPHEAEVEDTVPWQKPLRIGQRIPVTVSTSDPQRLQIEWDGIPDMADAAREAGELAASGDPEAAARALGFKPADPDG
jgi:hypothetical protein